MYLHIQCRDCDLDERMGDAELGQAHADERGHRVKGWFGCILDEFTPQAATAAGPE